MITKRKCAPTREVEHLPSRTYLYVTKQVPEICLQAAIDWRERVERNGLAPIEMIIQTAAGTC